MALELDPTFRSAHAKYVGFNFHPQFLTDQIAGALTSDVRSGPRVVLLRGEEQSGRKYLAEAAVYAAEQRGAHLRYARLDLQGYEVETGSLDAYLTLQLSKLSAARRSKAQAIAEKLKVQIKAQTPSLWGAAIFSIALTADLPVSDIVAALGTTFDTLPGPTRSPRERFSIALRNLTAGSRLIVHVLDPVSLSPTLRAWLLDELAIDLDAVLLCSMPPSHTIDTQGLPVAAFEVARLGESAIARALDERFQPNAFPGALVKMLWSYSEGYAGRVATKMHDLLGLDLLIKGDDDVWRLQVESEDQLADLFGVDEGERMRLIVDALPPAIVEPARRFLELAALCNDVILVKPLALRSGVAADGLDDFIDALDESLVPAILEDKGYAHPSFPGELVYAFANPIAAATLLRRIPGGRRETLAGDLLKHLIETRGMPTRGTARLYVELASHCSKTLSDDISRTLTWWIGTEEAAELSARLRDDVIGGRLPAVTVLGEIRRHFRSDWPAYRCLALVEALIDPNGAWLVEWAQVPECQFFHAACLYDSGRFRDALAVAVPALETMPPQTALAGYLLVICGNSHREFGEFDQARAYLERARDAMVELFGDAADATIFAKVSLAGVYKVLRRYEDAEQLYLHVIATLERLENPPWLLGIVLDNLGVLYSDMERKDEATTLSRRALSILEQTLGENHLETAIAMNNVADRCMEQGDVALAESLFSRSLAVRIAHLGPEHPDVASALDNLGYAYFTQKRYDEAFRARLRAIEIFEKQLGPSAPDTLIAMENLLAMYEETGRYQEAAAYADRIETARANVPFKDDVRKAWTRHARYARVRRMAQVIEALRAEAQKAQADDDTQKAPADDTPTPEE